MQRIAHITSIGLIESFLPDPREQVLPGIVWGRHDQLFTPAYWVYHAWLADISNAPFYYKLGDSLYEEIAACLLGGYGIRAEVGTAAFARLRERGQLNGEVSPGQLFASLSEPLSVHGNAVKYRFAHQRSIYLAEALKGVSKEVPPEDDLSFRSWLLKFRGIGPKTASWITRNWKNSDRVAIIDIHISRAGLLIGLYRSQTSLQDYYKMERDFLSFARAVGVRASILDTIIWSHMRRWGNLAT
jgi:N-glycosylase/DNA lyase